MSSFKVKLAASLADIVPGTKACRNMLLIPGAADLVRGFFLEGTPYSRRCYIREFVLPIVNPLRSISLNYSHRMIVGANGQQIFESSEDLSTTVANLTEKINASSAFESLRTVGSLGDFVGRYPLPEDTERLNILLDYAVAYCVNDSEDTGLNLLNRIISAPSADSFSMAMKAIAKSRRQQFEAGGRAFKEAIKAIEVDNINLHFPGLKIALDQFDLGIARWE